MSRRSGAPVGAGNQHAIEARRSGWGCRTAHMLTGLPSASNGVRFLLNFLPPEQESVVLFCCGRMIILVPPLVGLLNFPALPRPPGAMLPGL